MKATPRPELLVLIDGSNVSKCAAWLAVFPGDDDRERQLRLVDAVVSWGAGSGVECVLAFDGVGPFGAPGERAIGPVAQVVATGAASADTRLEKIAAVALRERRRYWLVTNDGTLRATAGGGSELAINSDDFVAELGGSGAGASPGHVAPEQGEPTPGGSRIASSVDEETLARLEQLRRGQ